MSLEPVSGSPGDKADGAEHDTHGVVVRLDELLLIIDYDNGSVDEPIDQPFLDGLVEAAVAKVEASLG